MEIGDDKRSALVLLFGWAFGLQIRRGWLQELCHSLQSCGAWKVLDAKLAERSNMAQFALDVNGQRRMVEADGEMPLLWALRDVLELTGTKYGCGIGMCGACTVHVDGAAVRSCQTLMSDVGARKIITIEGLGHDGLHPVQKAWIAEQAPQCGYCQSGQIMSAAALLAGNKQPTDAQIDDAMAGNICRCATYSRIRKAIHTAAQEMRS